MKDRNGLGLSGEVGAWLVRISDADIVAVDILEVLVDGSDGARSTSHWSDAMGMLKGLGCHWQNTP